MTGETTKRSRRRGPKPDRRRALELLAASREGCTEAIMLAHYFTVELMGELGRAGLALATMERSGAPEARERACGHGCGTAGGSAIGRFRWIRIT
jgi:hypothetical protein